MISIKSMHKNVENKKRFIWKKEEDKKKYSNGDKKEDHFLKRK